ncbi:MAG: Bug family tripartite tricarboxylate transporter substrate binding protein, partial [Mycobacterium sp.]
MKHAKVFAVMCVALLAAASCAKSPDSATQARNYPTRPVSLVFPFGAGSPGDVNARKLAETIKPSLHGTVQVVDKPGAAGTLGVTEVVRAKPDGYTLGLVPIAPMTVQPLRSKLPYGDPSTYQPIAMLTTISEVLFVPASSPWKTLEQFLTYAKQHPGKVSIATSGVGTVLDIDSKLLAKKAHTKWTDVAFSGEQDVAANTVGGQTTAGIAGAPGAINYVKAGKLRVLAAFSAHRLPELPNVPTAVEKGYDITFGVNNFIIGPKGLPTPVVKKWSGAVQKAVNTAEFQQFAKRNSYAVTYK